MLNFRPGKGYNHNLIYAFPDGWHWSRDDGHYHQNRDFFWVHWEVHDNDPQNIRLHVECPKAAIDPDLNAIKEELVEALLTPKLESAVEEQGYKYKRGSRIAETSIRNNKSTEPFRVVLRDNQRRSTSQEDLEQVHGAVGAAVDGVLQRFAPQLNQHFGR